MTDHPSALTPEEQAALLRVRALIGRYEEDMDNALFARWLQGGMPRDDEPEEVSARLWRSEFDILKQEGERICNACERLAQEKEALITRIDRLVLDWQQADQENARLTMRLESMYLAVNIIEDRSALLQALERLKD